MPFLASIICGALLQVAASLVGRVLLALGMGAVTYTGLNIGLSYFGTTFTNAMGSAGPTLAGMMGVLQLDTCLAIFTAAALAKLAIAGASSGTVKRIAMK